MHEVAHETGLHEKSLYKSLSSNGNPTLNTLLGLADAMHMRLVFMPKTALAVGVDEVKKIPKK